MGRPFTGHVRISVRALIIMVLIIGGGLGLIVRQSQIQRAKQSWRSPKPAGLSSTSGSTLPLGRTERQPWWPKWLMEWVGVDYFGNVVHVNFRRDATDADLVHVRPSWPT